ncbi:hypothetical protein BIY24_13370 [Halobacteriovorax marinus]|uniref:acyl-[acyl-carrier-protein] thioesterase n=1 Tax=Halobacteriovorax marinus TaxID=97084 RepID=UPI000BC31800|nr:acyl-ACP thioesterase domain-containing protein [Halobacteriovorax marinus]ATH08900.1 hypothetical protein BIY24_13370 [Halobacteriovorax marinus]
MKSPVFKKKYQVSISNVNINKRLGLFGLLGYLQDIATLHAEIAGFGLDEMISSNSFWVLVRQEIRINKFPKWNDEIEIQTWSRTPQGMYAFREFEFFLNDEKVGSCSTAWMILSGDTRRIKKPDFPIEKINPRLDSLLDYCAERIKVLDNFELVNEIKVRISDLDLNMHVNNTKYTQWVLDSIPIELHKSAKLKNYQINFLKEAHLGDEIDIYRASSAKDESAHDTQFKGIRRSDQSTIFYVHIIADT